jgi:hypothetical protein
MYALIVVQSGTAVATRGCCALLTIFNNGDQKQLHWGILGSSQQYFCALWSNAFMNKYVRNLIGMVFQVQPTQQAVRVHPQSSPTSPEEWRQHWQQQDQPWRTEPEIDAKRQEELSKRRTIIPDIEKGIYPFKGMKLSRADAEWLLVQNHATFSGITK